MEGKRVKDSSAIMALVMSPQDANSVGNVHGGVIMKLIDTVAGVVAMRHARSNVVTASIDRLDFHNPVFIPTYSSWLNLIEVLFNLLQAKVLRRGVFPSKQILVVAIMTYRQKFNEEGRSFHWRKSAEAIITSVNNLTRH